MRLHTVRTHPSADGLARSSQLAWALAELAADPVPVDPDVAQMVVNRVVDDTAVAAAALDRAPVAAARAQAVAHPSGRGSTVLGVPGRFAPEWAAWANGVAVRELDFHDTYLAAEYAHPGDTIPPLVAVAQHVGADGERLVAAITTAYEVQIDLARSISLHAHKIDHVAHLGPAVAAGLGTLLDLSVEVTFQAIGQALHTTTATRQSRKGQISTWKAYAPALAGKLAIEAVDRAMRGQTSPEPIYEGEDGVIAWLLDGPDGRYEVRLPEPGEPRRAILDSFTKEHSAEYQAQAWIDLARRLRTTDPRVMDPTQVSSIVLSTSHHTHAVIGSGARDPQKYDPAASRETLDHSLPYILAVALQDGVWHHVTSYAPARAARPDTVALWQSISTVEDPVWTARYHAADPRKKAFGGSVLVTFTDGSTLSDQITVADAHPAGARPFTREDYERKLRTLAEPRIAPAEIERFLALADKLPVASAAELGGLTLLAAQPLVSAPEGLF